MDDTRLAAHLPTAEIEIGRQTLPEHNGESILIRITAAFVRRSIAVAAASEYVSADACSYALDRNDATSVAALAAAPATGVARPAERGTEEDRAGGPTIRYVTAPPDRACASAAEPQYPERGRFI
ncbi:MAG TPA: hypothetical protein VNZ04_14405 [Trinickia sp.]|jgi:hypothetical protein|nr:hypothetical protein [Trinickia sp.]